MGELRNTMTYAEFIDWVAYDNCKSNPHFGMDPLQALLALGAKHVPKNR